VPRDTVDGKRLTQELQTVFGMPFFDLDDNLAFANIKMVWVFFVISGILTSLTFLASYYWDTRSKLAFTPTDSPSAIEEHAVEGDDERARIYEPDPANPAETTDISQRVINKGILLATLQNRITEEPNSGLEDIGFDELNNLIPLAQDNETYTGQSLDYHVELFLALLRARVSNEDTGQSQPEEEEEQEEDEGQEEASSMEGSGSGQG